MKKLGLIILSLALFASCGGDGAKKEKKEVAQKTEVKKEEPKKEAKAAADVDGKALFISNGCVACHQVDKKTVGPALKEIAKSYEGKKDAMVKFLKGEGEAIVDPAQFAVMKPNLEITKKMADNEVGAIVDYILSVK